MGAYEKVAQNGPDKKKYMVGTLIVLKKEGEISIILYDWSINKF